MRSKTITRRDSLKIAGALALIPIVAAAPAAYAQAKTNEAMRKALNYQDKPKDGKQCSTCLQFVPGSSPTAMGGCKIIPNDNQIAPAGWCTAWVKKP